LNIGPPSQLLIFSRFIQQPLPAKTKKSGWFWKLI
jgi:hypothetical protein